MPTLTQFRRRPAWAALAVLVAVPPACPGQDLAGRVRQVREAPAAPWAALPWAASLTAAQRLGARERCPVFLFSLRGNLATGRC